MTVSHSAEDRILGGERVTDGLWTHKGKLTIGPLGARVDGTRIGGSGDLNVNRGSGQGAIYFGGQDKYLYFDGTQFLFNPPLGSNALAANSAQQLMGQWGPAVVSWQPAQAGVWTETPINVTCTTTGALVRIEYTVMVTCSSAGSHCYTGLGWDGGLQKDSLAVSTIPLANAIVTQTVVWYVTPVTGAHRFAVFMFCSGQLTPLWSGGNCALYVTEQKR